ncbi:MAG: alpha/beta fold hydrolase [Candidatus Methanofastidiosia archaeon]
MKKRFVLIDGLRICYLEDGEGESIILVHGWPTYSYLWRCVILKLSKTHKIFALDLIGFGDSDKPLMGDYSIEKNVEMLKIFMEKLELERASLVGHDLGGLIVPSFAAKYPEKISKLVVMNTTPYHSMLTLPMKLMIRALQTPIFGEIFISLMKFGFKPIFKIFFYKKSSITDESLEEYKRPLIEDENTKRAWLNSMRAIKPEDFKELEKCIKNIKTKTLILWAENDYLVAPLSIGERLSCEIEGSVLKTIPECGHFMQEESPDLVSKHLSDFLTKKSL